MDSGSITALASNHIPRLMTFTGGFDLTNVSGFEAGFDERKDAEALSALFKTEHYQMVFHAGDLEWALSRVIWAIEDLRVGMCYPYYYTARLAGRFVKVVLAGTGGDEIFAGYPWRYRTVIDAGSFEEFRSRYYGYWNRLIPDGHRSTFFSPEVLRLAGGHEPAETFRLMVEGARGLRDPIRQALYLEAKTFLHGLLVVEDKLSMAHSLESRVPLLDHAIVDFVTKLPTRHLVNYGWEKNLNGDENLAGKYLFRRAMEGLLPDHILLKRKQGFSAPEQSWYQGPLMTYVNSVLLDRRTLSRGFFQEAAIRRILDEHLAGKVNHRLLIWSLLSFEFWNRLFMDGEGLRAQAGV
jgi:asparagine synthase (glutamine-hydrolysing)